MTVATYAAQPPRDDIVEDGVTTVHSIPFKFFDAAEIVVTRILVDGTEILLAQPTHYSVTGGAVDGVAALGSITKVNGGIDGATLRIDRNTALSQLVVYDPTDDFPARSHQEAIDRLEMQIQEIRRDLITRADVVAIILATLIPGTGIDFDVDEEGGTITINNTMLDPAVLAQTIYNILNEGAGIDITLDEIRNLITITAAQLDDLPDCVMLSGDQQTYDGAFAGSGGSGLTTEDVQDIVGGMILNGTGITKAYDDTAGTLTIGCSVTPYTDEQARDALGTALQSGTLIALVDDDAGDHITINSTALAPAYAGVVPADHAGAFAFTNAMNGLSTNWTGGAAAITIDPEATTALADGWAHVVRNNGSAAITIHRGAGVSLHVNGATASADATIAVGGVATINRWGDDDFTIVGPGVS
jgi:hypothetical protein